MKIKIIMNIVATLCFLPVFAQSNKICAEAYINNGKIRVQVIEKNNEKFWKVSNIGCDQVVVGTEISIYDEPYGDRRNKWTTVGIYGGDTLKLNYFKTYPINFFAGSSFVNQEAPSFFIKWRNFDLHSPDFLVNFYKESGEIGEERF